MVPKIGISNLWFTAAHYFESFCSFVLSSRIFHASHMHIQTLSITIWLCVFCFSLLCSYAYKVDDAICAIEFFSFQNKIWNLPDLSTILPKFIHNDEESLLDQPKFCRSGSAIRHLFWRLSFIMVAHKSNADGSRCIFKIHNACF